MTSLQESAQLSSEVARKVALAWPLGAERDAARSALVAYGVDAGENEVERAQLAVLKLCNGSLSELASLVAAAKTDYRDVLMWAEYPEQSQSAWTARANLSDAERKELKAMRERDRLQYEQWRKL